MSNENIIQNNERRAAFARQGANVPHLLARVTPTKTVAVSMVADFFCEFMERRADLEPQGWPSALKTEIQQINPRIVDFNRMAGHLDNGGTIQVPEPAYGSLKKEFVRIARDVATALMLEAQNENFDEFKFWREFYLGMADADPSGVVIIAARLVFLDHEEGFRTAFRLDAALAAPSTRH